LMLDRVFGTGEKVDEYWTRRYRGALVVAVGCSKPMDGCFCNWMGSSPFGNAGADIMMTDIGDAFLVEPCSEKGISFLEQEKGLSLPQASGDDLRKAEAIRSAAESAMPAKLDVSPLKEILDKSWDSPLWDRLADRCLSCAACAYLCPTCHCFDIQDEKLPGSGRYQRIRIWDSCMATLFTKEASGHNPRPTGKERLRQRVMHKFNYFVEAYNETACVGCGRCVRSCPVNIDIRDVLAEIVNAG
jgi:sulfhydrogenase subunit beta (sulfur reductase)